MGRCSVTPLEVFCKDFVNITHEMLYFSCWKTYRIGDCDQIFVELGAKYVIYQVSHFSAEKRYLCLQTWKSHLSHVNVDKWEICTKWEKWNYLSSIMLNLGDMVIKMPTIVHFLSFLPMTAKNQSQFGQNF